MSVQCNANTQRLRRIVGWDASDPNVSIALWYRFNSFGAFRSVWSGDDNAVFVPGIYFDPGPSTVYYLHANGAAPGTELIATAAINTWYFTAIERPAAAAAAPGVCYVGVAGGALSTAVPGDNADGWYGDELILFNEDANDQTQDGQQVFCKVWTTLLSAEEVANEYLRGVSSRTADGFQIVPLLNATNAGVDVSGNGNDFTVSGTPTTQRTMPPVTWRGALDIQ